MSNHVYDVIVVGGGVMGASTAAQLGLQSNLKVLLLDQFQFGHHNGSSHGESRIVRVAHAHRYLIELAKHALSTWKEIEYLSKTKLIEWKGGLDFALRDNPILSKIQSVLTECNVEFQTLSSAAVKATFPMFNLPENYEGIYTKQAGIINATKAVKALLKIAQEHGVTLLDQVKVSAVQKDSSGTIRILTSTGRAFHTKKCVFAAGAWISQLVHSYDPSIQLHVQPIQTSVCFWKCQNEQSIQDSTNAPIFINYQEPHIYGFPVHEKPGHIKVCLHTGPKIDPDAQSNHPEPEGVKLVQDFIKSKLSGIESNRLIESENCMYSMTEDQEFILDKLPSNPNILVVGGFSGHGFKMGSIVGKIVTDLILRGHTSIADLAPYAIDRPNILSTNSRL